MTPSQAENGYTRLETEWIGPGAKELLWRAEQKLHQTERTQLTGTVAAVFDRTLSVRLPVNSVIPGPTIATFGVSTIRDGPLVAKLNTDHGFSFRRRGFGQGQKFHLSLTGERILQVQIGHTLIIETPIENLVSSTGAGGQAVGFPRNRFQYDAEPLETHVELLSRLHERGVTDGLGRLEWVRNHHNSESTGMGDRANTPEVEIAQLWPLITAIQRPHRRKLSSIPPMLDIQEGDDRRTLISLLGRGPGSTPAGDDFLIGLLLILRGIADPSLQIYIRRLGHQLSRRAMDRTTPLSAAFLAQATARRGAAPALSCAKALIRPEPSLQRLQRHTTQLLDTGHTSGADVLAGMITATTVVIPTACAASEN